MRYTIGLVKHDDVTRINHAASLESRGFVVRSFADRQSATHAFTAVLPDVAVLDIVLGQERDAGFRLCSALRKLSKTLPVIFLMPNNSNAYHISGLYAGGDDCLPRKGSIELLSMRIETLLARRNALLEPGDRRNRRLVVGPLAIDLRLAAVTWRGHVVDLPLTHYWMVLLLASTPHEAKSATELMTAASINVAPNTIAAHIRSIRTRFRAIDEGFDTIRTERGRGYRWAPWRGAILPRDFPDRSLPLRR